MADSSAEWNGDREGLAIRAADLKFELPDGYELREGLGEDAVYLYAPDGRLVLKEWPARATPDVLQAAALEDLAGRRP